MIETLYGVGYRFKEAFDPLDLESASPRWRVEVSCERVMPGPGIPASLPTGAASAAGVGCEGQSSASHP